MWLNQQPTPSKGQNGSRIQVSQGAKGWARGGTGCGAHACWDLSRVAFSQHGHSAAVCHQPAGWPGQVRPHSGPLFPHVSTGQLPLFLPALRPSSELLSTLPAVQYPRSSPCYGIWGIITYLRDRPHLTALTTTPQAFSPWVFTVLRAAVCGMWGRNYCSPRFSNMELCPRSRPGWDLNQVYLHQQPTSCPLWFAASCGSPGSGLDPMLPEREWWEGKWSEGTKWLIRPGCDSWSCHLLAVSHGANQFTTRNLSSLVYEIALVLIPELLGGWRFPKTPYLLCPRPKTCNEWSWNKWINKPSDFLHSLNSGGRGVLFCVSLHGLHENDKA